MDSEGYTRLNWIKEIIKNTMKKENPNQVKWAQALEMPCGPGRVAFVLQDFIQETFGIDACKENIDNAIIKYGNKDPSRVTFLQADFNQIPQMFQEGSFDLVILYDHPYDDWQNVLSTVRKMLKPTGLLFVYSCVSAESADPEVDHLFKMLPLDHLSLNETLTSKIPRLVFSYEKDVSARMTLSEVKEWYRNEKAYKQLVVSENRLLIEKIEKQFAKLEALNVDNQTYKVQHNYLYSRIFKDDFN